MNKKELIKFEDEIAELFNGGKIRAPVHLYYGNEDQIIDVFKKIRLLWYWKTRSSISFAGADNPGVSPTTWWGKPSIIFCQIPNPQHQSLFIQSFTTDKMWFSCSIFSLGLNKIFVFFINRFDCVFN